MSEYKCSTFRKICVTEKSIYLQLTKQNNLNRCKSKQPRNFYLQKGLSGLLLFKAIGLLLKLKKINVKTLHTPSRHHVVKVS